MRERERAREREREKWAHAQERGGNVLQAECCRDLRTHRSVGPRVRTSTHSIGCSQASIAHGADPDSDLARPSVRAPSSLGTLTWSAAHRLAAGHAVARPSHLTRSEAAVARWMELPGRLGARGGAGRRRTELNRQRTSTGGPGACPEPASSIRRSTRKLSLIR